MKTTPEHECFISDFVAFCIKENLCIKQLGKHHGKAFKYWYKKFLKSQLIDCNRTEKTIQEWYELSLS